MNCLLSRQVFFSGVVLCFACALPLHSEEVKPTYTGAPMSMNFQNIEVRIALQVLADFTGLNIITSDSVTGSLTLKLHKVPWDQVLDTNKQQPDGWKVNERTLRDWRSTGVLKIREYLRPNGTHGLNRNSEDDKPLYKWGDVERLRSQGVPRGHRKRMRSGRSS